MSPDDRSRIEFHKDGHAWPIGTQADVAWINDSTTIGFEITSGIPPVFAAYATIVSPGEEGGRRASTGLIVRILREHAAPQAWWLGFLDNGVDDVVFPEAPRVMLYPGWPYVLVLAGPEEALRWRQELRSWHGPGPDLMFPVDRSWLVSWLWDDDWRCVGGSQALVDALMEREELDVRQVQLGEDATPPGFGAF